MERGFFLDLFFLILRGFFFIVDVFFTIVFGLKENYLVSKKIICLKENYLSQRKLFGLKENFKKFLIGNGINSKKIYKSYVFLLFIIFTICVKRWTTFGVQ